MGSFFCKALKYSMAEVVQRAATAWLTATAPT
jgi:hypothetical protein